MQPEEEDLATPALRPTSRQNALSAPGGGHKERAHTVANVLEVPLPVPRSDEQETLTTALQHHDVPLDGRRSLLGPRFAWNTTPATGTKGGLTRYLRRRSSASSVSSLEGTPDHPVKIQGSMPSLDRLWQEIVLPVLRDLFSIGWIAFVLWSCAMVSQTAYTLRFVLALIAIASYIASNFLVWFLIAPLSSGTLKIKLWFSHKRLKRLEHQFEHHVDRAERSKFKAMRPSETIAAPSSMLSKMSIPFTPAPHTANKLQINRAQSALGALPLLVWSAQAANTPPRLSPETRRHALGGEDAPRPSAARWQPNTRSSPITARASALPTTQDILQAISQPDIGFLDKRNVQFHRASAKRLPQIREDRAREAGRLFSEGDWQAMLDVEAAGGNVRKRDRLRDWFQSIRSKAHNHILTVTSQPAVILSMILRNTAWCGIFLWCLTCITRRDHTEEWNYDGVPSSFWWLESIFQWQMTIDYVLGYTAATEKLKYMFSWQALVDIVSLPAMQVVVEALSGRSLAYYTTTFGAIRFFRLFRMERQVASIFPWLDAVRLIIMGLAVDTTVVLLAFACSMWVAEGPQVARDFINVSDYVYYSIVTMTTVGYGDYSPTTRIARWITSAAILAGFIIFPYHVQRLLSAFHIPPVVVGHMPSVSSDFIFIYGKMRPRQLACMIHELTEALPGSIRHILVVTPFPAITFRSLVQNILRQSRLHVCVSQKCPTSDEMQMYCALARAVFIIADPKPQPSALKGHVGTYPALLAEDQKAFLRVAKAQPWCWPSVPVAVQLSHGMYSGLAMELGAYHVVPLEWLKLRSIGKSVAGCQGFIPLCFNWYHTPSQNSLVWTFFEMIEGRKDALEAAVLRQLREKRGESLEGGTKTPDQHTISVDATGVSHDETSSNSEDESRRASFFKRHGFLSSGKRTMKERRLTALEDKTIRDELNFYYYFRGLRYQVYRFDFPQCMDGIDFSLAVRLLYRRFGVFLIGLVSIDKRFVMSPIGYTIGAEKRGPQPGAYPLAGVVLAPSLHDVNHLSKLKVFHVAPVTVEAEKKYLARNLRSKEDLQRATLSFMEDMSKVKQESHILGQLTEQNQALHQLPSVFDRPRHSVTSSAHDLNTIQSPRVVDEIVIKEVASAVEAFDLAAGGKPFVLCCGWPKDLYQFLSAIETNRPSFVLILAAQDAPAFARWNHDLWEFRNSCAWLHGSPLSMEDLKNAGALLAECIVILSSRHAFSVNEDEETSTLTTVDNQTILVRQQIFALFARVNEYLSHWDQEDAGADYIGASTVMEEESTGEGVGHTERIKIKIPLLITELQDRESVEYLSSPKDLFLLSAFRNLQSKKGRLDFSSQSSLLTRLSGRDYVDDVEWAAEGGRRPHENSTQFNTAPTTIDSSAYTIQSEFRSGQLYLRELSYSLLAFCLPVSRFAIDTTFIEHLVDGSHAPLADLINKRIRGHSNLSRYRVKSPLSLIPIPKMFIGAPFKDAFSYLMKMELKLAIAVLRKIEAPALSIANPIESLRGSGAQELVISCPSPTMPLMAGDRIYVLSACPKYVAGLFFLEKPHLLRHSD